MKSSVIAYRASALFLFFLSSVTEASSHSHGKVHHGGYSALKKHHHRHAHPEHTVEKRTGQCSFPSDGDIISVTPKKKNAGWALSPDQPCERGSYCPYACPPGMVMAQWDPEATTYSYPQSMNGGLFCDESGQVSKPFPNKPYCVDASGALTAKNDAGDVVSFCQTVLPGNEAMLIPTRVTDFAKLAVPDHSYWCSTAAHYYINPPGVDTDTACVWGSKDNPWGNWSPYVAGANSDSNGETFVKLGWNPIYLEPETPFKDESPSFGVRVECDGNCNGLPCEINPSKNSVNEVTGSGSSGAGGGDFCVVTVPKGSTANIVVFGGSGGNGGGSPPPKESSSSPPPPPPPSSPAAPSSPSSTSSSTTPPSSTPGSSTVTSSSSFSPLPSSSTLSSSSMDLDVYPHVMVEKPSSSMLQASNSTTPSIPSITSPSAELPTDAASMTSLSIMSLTFSFVAVSLFLNF